MARNGKKPEAPPDPGSDLINPVTVADMVATYNRAMEMVQEGYRIISQGYTYLEDARDLLTVTFGKENGFGTINTAVHPTAAAETIRRQLQRSIWKVIIDKLDIWKLMTLTRAEELRDRLETGDLPEITDEEILAMIEATRQNARDYAEEFALEVYEWLTPGNKKDSRWEAGYATNKREARDELGKKVILGWIIDRDYFVWGSKTFHVNYSKHDKLAALDRLFALLDGKEPSAINSYQTPLIMAIEAASHSGYFETEYFKGRACKNGNLHLEFNRPDLVQKLNQIAGNAAALKQKKHKIKVGDHTVVDVPEAPKDKEARREEDFFWSSGEVVQKMLDLVPLPLPLLLQTAKILEPSAGEGHIADCLVAAGARRDQILCIEKNYDRLAVLLSKGYDTRDLDFLKFKETGWDRIYMNPPFSQEQDILHVMHAYSLLTPGGWLCAVMSEHNFIYHSRTRDYFTDWLKGVHALYEKLPANSFIEAGTDWDTRIVAIQKDWN